MYLGVVEQPGILIFCGVSSTKVAHGIRITVEVPLNIDTAQR